MNMWESVYVALRASRRWGSNARIYQRMRLMVKLVAQKSNHYLSSYFC